MRTAVLLLLLSVVGDALSAPVCPAKCLQKGQDDLSQPLHKRLSMHEEEAPFQKRCNPGYCFQGFYKTARCCCCCPLWYRLGHETQPTEPVTNVSKLAAWRLAYSSIPPILSMLTWPCFFFNPDLEAAEHANHLIQFGRQNNRIVPRQH